MLRAIMWGIGGAILGAGVALYLALSRAAPVAVASALGTELPLAGAGLGAGLRLWIPAWFGKDGPR